MISNYKFRITPTPGLSEGFPAFDLYIKKKIKGFIWTEEEYTWSCLPGYMSENMGWVCAENMGMKVIEGKVTERYWLYCESRPYDNDPAENSTHAVLNDVPISFKVGSTGSADVVYGGFRAKDAGIPGMIKTPYASWELLLAY